MSTIYNIEPPTKGKVILRTSLGELDIELWPKEAPMAVRNFVQLCMEGYYDGCIFHRLLKDFLIQTGDPTGTGRGGESAYGRPFKDEFHSRLNFTHRGLVACANANAPHTNGSQFFITLDRTDGLNKKNTIFGKVTGDTIYNLANMNELEVDDADRPNLPPVIEGAEILWNPFDDVVPRTTREEREAAEQKRKAEADAAAAAAPKKKLKKDTKLLSFGEDAEGDDDADASEPAPAQNGRRGGIRSAHDVLEDERLVKANTEKAAELAVAEAAEAERMRAAVAARLARRPPAQEAAAPPAAVDRDDDVDNEEVTDATFDERMRAKMLAKRQTKGDQEPPPAAKRKRTADSDDEDDDLNGGGGRRQSEAENRRAKAKEGGSKTAAVKPSKQVDVIDAELLKPWERKRQEYKQRKKVSQHREKDTLARLHQFTSKLRTGPADEQPAEQPAPAEEAGGPKASAREDIEEAYAGRVRGDIDHRALQPAAWRADDYLDLDDTEAATLDDLRGHKLVFAKTGVSSMDRKDDVDDLVVHDPLLEAGKAKWNKQQAKLKKRGTEWAGAGPVT